MKGKRTTRQRLQVLEAVHARKDHPTADQIYLDVRQEDGKISRGTVYRNLAELAAQGEITHARLPGADRYDLRQDQHYHLYCTQCGQVVDAPISYRPEDDAAVEQATGFRIARHRLVFEGLCPACAAAENHQLAPRKELSNTTNHEGGTFNAPEQVCRHPDGEKPSRSL